VRKPARRASLTVAVAFAIATALLLGGCAPSAGTRGSPVATSTVDLPASYKFEPASIVVTPGSVVTWTNHDNFTHSVAFLDGGLPTAPNVMDPGASTTFTFEKAGVYHYQCHLHPQNMQGTVTVQAGG
jgi:plastocyanin